MISSKFIIREHNEAVILKEIINHPQVSRSDLSKITSMNKTSVSDIVKTLIDDELIIETKIGQSDSQGGRRPILLSFNPYAGLVLSIDIGSRYIEGILTDLSGGVINRFYDNNISVTAENVLDCIQTLINQLCDELPNYYYGIVGLSIGIHGIVNNHNIIFTPAYDIDKVALKNILEDKYEFPIFIENEANLSALGEYAFGTDSYNLVSISSHTGIGAGIVMNGHLYNGNHGISGEIGHITVYPQGKLCPCGNHGCLELYASNQSLYSIISDTLNVTDVNSDQLPILYDAYTEQMTDIFEEYVTLMAIAIHNTILVYDPRLVILNCSVLRKVPELFKQIEVKINSKFSKNTQLQNSILKGDSILFGGVALVSKTFLNIPDLKFR